MEKDLQKRPFPEEALHQSEERVRSILDSLEDGYFEVDLAGKMIFCNESMARMFNYNSSKDLLGMHYKEYTDSSSAERVFEIFNKVFQTGVPHKGFVWELMDNKKKSRLVETSVTLILDVQGQKIGFRGILRDITRQKQIEEALRESEERYRVILESIEEGYYETNLAGNFVFFNEAFSVILGLSRDELLGVNYKRVVDNKALQKTFNTFNEVFRTGEPNKSFDFELIRQDGTKRYMEVSIYLQKDSNGKPVGFKGIARDITERKRTESALRENEVKYRTLFEAAQSAIFLVYEGKYIDCNSYTLKMFGCEQDQIIGRTPSEFSTPVQPDGLNSHTKVAGKIQAALDGEPQIFEWKHTRFDGTPFDAEVNLNRIEIGGKFYLQAIVRDITGRKQTEEALKAMSLVDDLTGLYNRRGFLTLAEQEIKVAIRLKRGAVLIFADLDDLKQINDTFGHLEGDQALINISGILKETFREPDILARIGGDEFVILAIEGGTEAGSDIITGRLQRNIDLFNLKANRPYPLSLSLGVVGFTPDQTVEIEALLARADSQMYLEKQKKKNLKRRVSP
jgi:diguanylate cyclase (GGDEF)-like protein/PAS domain S-box-containing protein